MQKVLEYDQYDIVALAETHLLPGSVAPEVPGYQSFYVNRPFVHDRAQKGCGGLAIYYAQHLVGKVSLWRQCEYGTSLWIRVDSSAGFDRDLYFAVCYFPPEDSSFYSHKDGPVDAEALFNSLVDDIQAVPQGGHHIMSICGDFNARTAELDDHMGAEVFRHADFDIAGLADSVAPPPRQNGGDMHAKANKFGKHLVELCQVTETWILNGRTAGDIPGQHTCEANGGKSVVDYFLAHPSVFHNVVQTLQVHDRSGIVKYFSDHRALGLTLRVSNPQCASGCQEQSIKPANKFRYDASLKGQYLQNFNQPAVLDMLQKACLETCDASSSVDLLRKAILSAVENTYKKVSTNPKRSKKWYDQECKIARKHLLDILDSQAADSNFKSFAYKQYRKLLRAKKRWGNKLAAKQLAVIAKEDSRKFWKIFNPQDVAAGGHINVHTWYNEFKKLLNVPIGTTVKPKCRLPPSSVPGLLTSSSPPSSSPGLLTTVC